VRERLEGADAAWVDGRATAGHQGAQVKRNLHRLRDGHLLIAVMRLIHALGLWG